MSAPAEDIAALSDVGLARRIARRDPAAVRLMTDRNNQRLFRAAWSILGNRAEAEDAVQSAYMQGFASIETFEGRSTLSTWLTRIVINEALGRVRAAARRRARLDAESVTDIADYRERLMRGSHEEGADVALARAQMRELLKAAVADLPRDFRTVFMMREVEGMPPEDVAAALGIPTSTVKTRLFRARRRLQKALAPEVHASLSGAFPFAGADCAELSERVVTAICGVDRPVV